MDFIVAVDQLHRTLLACIKPMVFGEKHWHTSHCASVFIWRVHKTIEVRTLVCTSGGGGGGWGGDALPYKQRGEPCQQISNEPLKGTNMGVAQAELYS